MGDLYAPRLAELAREFESRGVQFLGINANAHDTVDQIAQHARKFGLNFPVLRDEENKVADANLVERTCEVLVLDGLARLRYRGAIDDQYGVGSRKEQPSHQFLREALEQVLKRGPVATEATPVVGCLIDRVESTTTLSKGSAPRVRPASAVVVEALKAIEGSQPADVGKVTYAGDVAPIVQNKCQSCHRPGEVGPFPLLTYDDARKHAAMIREVVDDRRMPPWHADPRYGHFSNDRSLSPRERATLLAWVDQGTPLGDPARLPAAKTFPEGWTIGKPDLVFEIPEPQTVPAQGTVEYVRVRVPSGFKEDVWVQAAEARPSDRSVVHHIIVYIDDKAFRLGPGGGLARAVDTHLCGYAPGDMPSVYPDGSAKKVPAGSDFIFELHYTPIGVVKTDRSKVGLILAKAPVKHRAHTLPIATDQFAIPPGADNHAVRSSFTFRRDAHLLSFMPHMHLRGKSFQYEATYPDGRKEMLLSVPAYDFGWQSYYTLTAPKAMPRGTRIDCLAHFDNSANNPYNPNPKKTVRWGDQTSDEMMIGYVDYIDDAPPDTKPKSKPGGLSLPGSGSEVIRLSPRSPERLHRGPGLRPATSRRHLAGGRGRSGRPDKCRSESLRRNGEWMP
ncbi:MAG: redoxin domain-containing protein [Isosphaeraceae bacterium]